MENKQFNNIEGQTPNTQSNTVRDQYNEALEKIIAEQVACINAAVKVRADHVIKVIFENIQAYVSRAFEAPTVNTVVMSINLTPAFCLSHMTVIAKPPKNCGQNESHMSIQFGQYKGEHEKFASGEIFKRKLSDVLAKRLTEELGFTKSEIPYEYELELDLPSLFDRV